MNSKTTLSISDARKNIFRLSDEAQRPGNYYTLTENGRPKVVMLSAEEFESWQETLEVMSDFSAMKSIKETNNDIQTGKYKKYIKIDEIPNTSKTKRSKTAK